MSVKTAHCPECDEETVVLPFETDGTIVYLCGVCRHVLTAKRPVVRKHSSAGDGNWDIVAAVNAILSSRPPILVRRQNFNESVYLTLLLVGKQDRAEEWLTILRARPPYTSAELHDFAKKFVEVVD